MTLPVLSVVTVPLTNEYAEPVDTAPVRSTAPWSSVMVIGLLPAAAQPPQSSSPCPSRYVSALPPLRPFTIGLITAKM